MSTLRKVTFEFDDVIKIASGTEAIKWQRNYDDMIDWANVENNNKFVHNPVTFDIQPSEKVQEELDKHVHDMVENSIVSEYLDKNFIVKEDMICPVTKKHCDDECCPVGSECNISGLQNSIDDRVITDQDLEDILDKSLAAVDNLTENQIQKTMTELSLSEDEEYEDDSESEEETEGTTPVTVLTDAIPSDIIPVTKTVVKKKKKKKPVGNSLKK